MSLLRQDSPDDVVGAGIEGAIAGVQIGKFIGLCLLVVGVIAFSILKVVGPLILRFLAFILPILWRLLVELWHWLVSAARLLRQRMATH